MFGILCFITSSNNAIEMQKKRFVQCMEKVL